MWCDVKFRVVARVSIRRNRKHARFGTLFLLFLFSFLTFLSIFCSSRTSYIHFVLFQRKTQSPLIQKEKLNCDCLFPRHQQILERRELQKLLSIRFYLRLNSKVQDFNFRWSRHLASGCKNTPRMHLDKRKMADRILVWRPDMSSKENAYRRISGLGRLVAECQAQVSSVVNKKFIQSQQTKSKQSE